MNSDDPLEGQEQEQESAWDADDPRRKKDCFAPPTEPCECVCMHCHRTFMSDQVWLQKVINGRDGFEGFWMCPTPNCSGAGFTFDIFPTDPDHPANEGWVEFDDSDDEGEWESDGEELIEDELAEANQQWDPEELQYKMLDDDDIEGEEWKHGVEPQYSSGIDPHAEIPGTEDMGEEEKMYDQPDQRPRVIDWNEREHREPQNPGGSPHMGDDDIPF